MTLGGAVLSSAVSGAIAGAIGASAASGDHPVLRGALVTAAVNGVLTLIFAAGADSIKQVGTSGPPRQLRFP
jgi:hypothetical protein